MVSLYSVQLQSMYYEHWIAIIFILYECSEPEPMKKMRTLYSHAQKAKVAKYARFHGVRAASRHFGIHHNNAQRWLSEDLDTVKVTKRSKRKNKKGQGRKITYPQHIEDELMKWILEKREIQNVSVSTGAIRMKALSLIKPIIPSFKASEGWARGFLQRNNLVLRAKTSIAQMLPADLEEKIARFRQDVCYIRINGDFDYDLIANMDETPVYFDMVPSRTVDRKGIKVRTTKSEKRRITAVLACSSTGKMLPPMLIFKGTTSRSVRNVTGSEGTVVSYQSKAWVDEKQMLKWITDIWMKYTRKRPSLLFLDSFSAHLTDEVKDKFKTYNTTVVVIPGGCTSVLQPLDVSINKPVKAILRQSWEQYMLDQTITSSGKISPPSKQAIVNWIEEANDKLNSKPCIVKKAFLVTGLSNALGGYEDRLIRNDEMRKDIEKIINEVFGEETMGFRLPDDDQSDNDPFESDDDDEDHSENDEEVHSTHSSDIDCDAPEPESIVIPDSDNSDYDSFEDSISAPSFEDLDSDNSSEASDAPSYEELSDS